MSKSQLPKLTYDERNAFMLVRKTMTRKPEIAAALLEDMSKDVAVSVLLQAKRELENLQVVIRAVTQAVGTIAKSVKE